MEHTYKNRISKEYILELKRQTEKNISGLEKSIYYGYLEIIKECRICNGSDGPIPYISEKESNL